MQLETMQPADDWDNSGDEQAIEALSADGLVFHVWGGDWCGDCQRQLPAFAAALDVAGVADENVNHYPVEKKGDGSKSGPKVDEYGIELIPTVVVERDGEEVARFVEEESTPIATYLANQLTTEASA